MQPEQSRSETEHWGRLKAFMRDGVKVSIMTYAYTDYSAATSVFTCGNSETFHADKYCHALHRGDTITIDGQEQTTIQAHTLEQVMTSWTDPVKPCSHCTQDIETTADIAMEIDGVPEACLSYFEPGDKKVTTTVSRNDDGTVDVSETTSEVY